MSKSKFILIKRVYLRFADDFQKKEFLKHLKSSKIKYDKLDYKINFKRSLFNIPMIIFMILFLITFIFLSILLSFILNPNNLHYTKDWNNQTYNMCFNKEVTEEEYDQKWDVLIDYYNRNPTKSPTTAEMKDPSFNIKDNYPEFYIVYKDFSDTRSCFCYKKDNREFLISKELREDKCLKYMEQFSPNKYTFNLYILLFAFLLNFVFIIFIRVIFKYCKFKKNSTEKTTKMFLIFLVNAIIIYVISLI